MRKKKKGRKEKRVYTRKSDVVFPPEKTLFLRTFFLYAYGNCAEYEKKKTEYHR